MNSECTIGQTFQSLIVHIVYEASAEIIIRKKKSESL